jgi:hypothetical protein
MRVLGVVGLALVFGAVVAGRADDGAKSTKYVVGAGPVAQKAPAEQPKKAEDDTLVVKARVIEIPGTFVANDLYNYVYVMKYRVLEVKRGVCAEKEILVGQYNPLIPRAKIKDKMDPFVDGDVEKFEEGDTHELTLILPIDKVWQNEIEDEYFDVDASEKYYALKTMKAE